jgi:two-component system sensor histidine kinase SenX3
VNPAWTALLAGLIGLIVGAVSVIAARASERERLESTAVEPTLPAGVSEVLGILRSAAIVLDPADDVVKASPAAYAFGLVRGHLLVHSELRTMAAQVRRQGLVREEELDLPRGPLGRGRLVVHARVAPLGPEHVLVLVDDRTEARRVEEVRRDFVANVSHELKTPIGALHLLGEAVEDAAEDPEAVRRFAERMQRESLRLSALVQEIIELSRLQVADIGHAPQAIEVDEVVSDAIDRCRLGAQAKHIDVIAGGDAGTQVFGDHPLLVTAVRNLVDNAIAYSPEHTRVAVAVRRHDNLVEISVTDQGIGIPQTEQARIFERFYRVDPARSRATGGTGLGLSIVKHVAANHGGEVTMWSSEGQGSTFTLRLPEVPETHENLLTTPPPPTDLTRSGSSGFSNGVSAGPSSPSAPATASSPASSAGPSSSSSGAASSTSANPSSTATTAPPRDTRRKGA